MNRVEIICVGDELLIGQVINTNAAWMAEQLNLLGLAVAKTTVVGDDAGQMLDCLQSAMLNNAIVLITGGLGPTKDDITKAILAEYFQCGFRHDMAVEQQVRALFASRGYPISAINIAQADIPEVAEALVNQVGTAPALWFERDQKILVAMPGVPYEMKHLMEKYVLPRLKERFIRQAIVHRTILTQGTGESVIAERIADWESALPAHLKLAYLPSPGMVRLRITGYGNDEKVLQEEIEHRVKKLYEIIGSIIYGEGQETMASVIQRLFLERQLTLATAESCTGGLIACKLVSQPGASGYFKGSILAYETKTKSTLLNVSEALINKHGVVSEPVLKAMLDGALHRFNTDFVIATTGYTGPSGGTQQAPVGTIYIGVASKEFYTYRMLQLGNHRERNMEVASISALQLLRKSILKID